MCDAVYFVCSVSQLLETNILFKIVIKVSVT